MDLRRLISTLWNDIYPDNVIYLSSYRFERSVKYPGVGFKFFSDFRVHKVWMINEKKRIQRNEHNKKISEKYKPKPIEPPKPSGF